MVEQRKLDQNAMLAALAAYKANLSTQRGPRLADAITAYLAALPSGAPVAWRYRFNTNWNVEGLDRQWSAWRLMDHEPTALDAEFEIEALFSSPLSSSQVTEERGLFSHRMEEAGFVEFLNEDVPTIVRDIEERVAIHLDLNTRKVVGYRVYDPALSPPVKGDGQ